MKTASRCGLIAVLAVVAGWGLNLAVGQTAAKHATIKVKVPEGAQVHIGDQKTSQGGGSRTFYTPDLEPKFVYSYEFTIIGKDGVKQTRWVEVVAGETKTLDFTGPGSVAKEEPKKEVKKEEPKKEDPKVVKKEEPKKEEPKKEDPKVVKKEDPKKVEPKTGQAKERSFLFTYSGAVQGLKVGEAAQVWLPVPPDSAEQTVAIEAKNPADAKLGVEKQYGNKMLSFQAKANDKGEVPFSVTYKVTRKEVVGGKATLKPKESADQIKRFLEPDKLVPISGKPLELIKDKKLPPDQFTAAKQLYDVVNNHMKYDKTGKGWGRGDSEWACDSKFGNCTDFHSLFISMARGNKIPSKFEMGFSVPTKHGKGDIGGYHCWAWFMPEGKGWVPVDISEANRFPDMKEYYFGNLTEDRVQFTTGRDINLEPRQKGGALNFFIYPYAEVDGQPLPGDRIARKFGYEDLK